MKETRSAAPFVPEGAADLADLRTAAAHCEGCDLYKTATQTVFGEGLPSARVMFVGEQPGDHEDKTGQPFVGPTGRLLDQVLEDVGIERSLVYVTNAVKHFKWEKPANAGPDSKRRLHKKPSSREVAACHPWLLAEIATIRPDVIVCLGATAAQALLGKTFKVTQQRGEWVASPLAPRVLATVHPSALLRAPDEETRHREMARFTDDLRKVAEAMIG